MTDTERLDFLVSQGYVTALRRYMGGEWSLDDEIERVTYSGQSYREAIDAVMAPAPAPSAPEGE